MLQNIMLGAVLLVLVLVAQRIYSTWQFEKTRNAAAGAKRKAGTKSGRKSGSGSMSAQPYHSVTLVGDCASLETYKGKRFLASNAPPLPVPDCTCEDCHCHYVHHADRRDPKDDRRAMGRLAEEQYTLSGNSERRGSRGRRKSDGNWADIDEWSKAV